MKPKLFYLFCLFSFIFFLEATATVRYVSKTGTSTPPYTNWATASDSIAKCINICQSGDTVYVANGVYKEKVTMRKGLSLIGSGMDSCIIDTRELVEPTAYYTVQLKDSCKFIGFQLLLSTSSKSRGINCENVLDVNSLISNNKLINGFMGINVFNSNAKIIGNIISNMDRGINIEGFTSNYFPIIDNNIILYPRSYGIVNIIGCKPTITNNIIYLNKEYSQGLDGILRTPLTANNIVIAEVNGAGGYFFTLGGNIRNNFLIGHTLIYPGSAFGLWQGSYHVRNNLIMNTNYGVIMLKLKSYF